MSWSLACAPSETSVTAAAPDACLASRSALRTARAMSDVPPRVEVAHASRKRGVVVDDAERAVDRHAERAAQVVLHRAAARLVEPPRASARRRRR